MEGSIEDRDLQDNFIIICMMVKTGIIALNLGNLEDI
jgi:hypothetical protein